MGWTDLGCYGSSFYESPHLDKMATEGIKFTQSYCAGSVCSPTRSSIITGQVPARNGCTQFNSSIKGTEICFAEVLSEHGYETFFVGKWHVGGKSPAEAGFKTVPEVAKTKKDVNDPKETRNFTEAVLHFISQQSLETPFMAYVNYNAVHTPLREEKNLVEKYKLKLQTNPPKPGQPKGLETEGRKDNKQIQDDPYFAAMVEGIDTGVSHVLALLDEKGFSENTLVIFSSDNGGLSTKPCTSNLPLRAGKGWLYEGGVRVPTIMRWPKVIKPGTISDTPIYSTDFYPTFLSVARIPLRPNDHVDGLSLESLLR